MTDHRPVCAPPEDCPEFFAEVRPSPYDLGMIIRQCRLWAMMYDDVSFTDVADVLRTFCAFAQLTEVLPLGRPITLVRSRIG